MPKKTQEEIQESIDQSTHEWRERKVVQELYSKSLKKGFKFCKENNIQYAYIYLYDYYVTLGYYVTKSGIIKYSYAICSPKDTSSHKTASSIIGMKFLEGNYLMPNLILGVNIILGPSNDSIIFEDEIKSICVVNFKCLLEQEAKEKLGVINAPRKLLNSIKKYGVYK